MAQIPARFCHLRQWRNRFLPLGSVVQRHPPAHSSISSPTRWHLLAHLKVQKIKDKWKTCVLSACGIKIPYHVDPVHRLSEDIYVPEECVSQHTIEKIISGKMGSHSGKHLSITPTPPFAIACINLPDDLFIWEILVRLPVKHLLIYKEISPSWCAAIDDAGFVRRHRDFSRASPPSMLIIRRKGYFEEDSELSEDIIFHRLRMGETLDTLEEEKAELMLEKACPPEVEGITNKIFPMHCDGLVAMSTVDDQVFVCNPATQELVALPLGTPDVRIIKEPSVDLGFDTSCNQYVVARYFYQSYNVDESSGQLDYEIGHEVFMLGGDSWDITDDPPYAIGNTRAVFMQGAFYWGTYSPEDHQSGVLVRFSLRDRKFDMVPCPPEFAYHYNIEHLADLDGKLCYVSNITETTYDVWQLDDDGIQQPKWSLRCRIDPLDDDLGVDAFFPVWAGRGRIIVAVDYEKLYWCDEKSGYMEELVDLEEEIGVDPNDGNFYRYHVVPYTESLISIRVCNVH